MRAEDLFKERKSVKITTWSISRAGLARDLLPLVRLILEKADDYGSLNINTQNYLLNFSGARNQMSDQSQLHFVTFTPMVA